MKRVFTLLAALSIPLLLSAQKDFRRFSIGMGTGIANVHGDLRSPQAKNIYSGMAEYYFTPYFAGSAEVSMGNMSAQGLQSDRYFRSDFKAASGNIRFYVGHYIDRYRGPMYNKTMASKILEGFYAGAGAGVIKSSQKEINRKKDDPMYRGWDNDRDVIIPVSLGFDNSGFNSRLIAGIRAQFVFCLGDNLDGYAISQSGLDRFSTLSASIKYRFGRNHTFYH